MQASALVTLAGRLDGLPTGTQTLGVTWVVPAPVGEVLAVVLQSGDNTIAIPTGTTLVVVAPPVLNAIVLTLKGAGGDGGIALNPAAPFVLAPKAGTASFVITAASTTAQPTTVSFI